ncbi:MAG: DUF4465 domain-containing protein [Firmicutes bacterium]|nr:DUF4465 domain-containing protein [Bacillota bacterium]MCM1401244.1 DUF4465 domain-containing protein [Bacteroides sp.]MCM1477207.1 DUF4465 domain-containing protein [Bacteroides sp.]
MKQKFLYAAMLLFIGAGFTSCSDDDDSPVDNRIIVNLGFENAGIEHAGPTSYGANLYYGYAGKQFTEAEFQVTGDTNLHIGVNQSIWTEEIDFYGGGLAVSSWNIRSNPADQTNSAWWYSYENQCSVYNVKSVDGANNGAGAAGSNTFLVAFGYSDPNSMSSCSKMYFTNKAEFELVSVELCNTSYCYGTMMNKNPYGSTPDKNLKEAEGWFKVEFYGYDSEGNATNGGKPVEFYLADYRPLSATATEAIDSWTECDLSALGKVNAVEVNFKGSDAGLYGLNTPAYVCLDNLKVNVTPVATL